MPVLYPLLFTFRERLQVAGRLVRVTACGRVSAFQDPDDNQWWFYGVNPGALAGQGSTPNSAFADFRIGFIQVMKDFAEESASVDDFEKLARAFFVQVADETDREWWAAVEEVRKGNIKLPIPKKLAKDSPPKIEISVEVAPNSSEIEWASEGYQAAA